MKTIKIILKGQPMAKQSVRQGKSRNGDKVFFQPKKTVSRKSDYIMQIRQQLPKGFEMFAKVAYIECFEAMFEPLASHRKSKKIMKFINEGGIIEKTTKPDLHDNLKKLAFDAMSGLVFKDDGLVCRENGVSKVYGKHGQITIVISGI